MRKGIAAGVVLGVVAMAAAFVTPAAAQSSSEEIKKLKQANKDLEGRLSQLEQASAGQKLTDGQRQEVKNLVSEMISDAKKDMAVGGGPAWLNGLKFYGDFRLRYEGQFYNYGRSSRWGPGYLTGGGTPAGSSKGASRNRMRARLRFGFEKTWQDNDLGTFEVGFRLTSGETNDPTTSNQTMGATTTATDAGFNKRPVWIDLAYAKWSGKDALKGLSITGGKMKNPFQSSDLVWDGHVGLEGVWVDYKVPGVMNGDLVPFIGAGMFLVREVNQTATMGTNAASYAGNSGHTYYDTDTTMWAYNAGIIWNITKEVKWTSAFTYYQWLHSTGYLYAGTNADSNWRGNYAPAGLDFGVVNLTNKLDFIVPIGSYKLPAQFLFDWAYNTAEKYNDSEYVKWVGSGASVTEMYAQNGSAFTDGRKFFRDMNEQRNAFNIGLKLGQNKKKGDWSAGYNYKWVEANSVPGYWAESTFGFTNRQGHILNATYNLMDDLTVGANLYLSRPIVAEARDVAITPSPCPDYGVSPERLTTTFQIDLMWKF